jgi:D-alanyl-D-alanine carboxypeptidase
VAVAIAAAIALGGCGGSDDTQPASSVSDDQRAILATVDALQTASRRDDAAKICNELFTRALTRSIRDASKHRCEVEVRHTLTSPDARLSVQRKIESHGSRAMATVKEADGKASTVSFVKEAGRWRIDRITPVKSG